MQARGYYRVPVHLQPGMARFGGESHVLPVTDAIARDNLALPMGTDLTDAEIGEVVEAVRSSVASAVG